MFNFRKWAVISQEASSLLAVGVAVVALAVALPPDRENSFWILLIAAVIIFALAFHSIYEQARRRRIREQIIDGFAIFHTQGTGLIESAASMDRINEWEKRLANFLRITLGLRYEQRLLTSSGFHPTLHRISRYLLCLDTYETEMNSSTFNRDMIYNEEAKRQLTQWPIQKKNSKKKTN